VASSAQEPSQAPISGVDAVLKESGAQTYWVRRVVAFIIDAVIIFVVTGILVLLAALPFLVFSGPGAFGAVFGGVFGLFAGLILVLYFVVFEVLSGASIGKRILALKVVAAGGKAPTAGESFVRNISKIYWLLLILDVVVGLALSKEYTKKYTDKLMGTSVVDAASSA
jgi:uncharacterized RDD family membrane protein YckC